MNIRSIIYIVGLLFLQTPASASNKIFFLDESNTVLCGKVQLSIYPGPPNYENVKNGDVSEKGYYLQLKNPVDVAYSMQSDKAKSPVEFWQKNVSKIQLLSFPDRRDKRRSFNQQLCIKGELTCWQTGHHHTPVLLDVEDITY